jgi:hypothetical protein
MQAMTTMVKIDSDQLQHAMRGAAHSLDELLGVLIASASDPDSADVDTIAFFFRFT